jgi:two-component system, chemotaxis family, sensor kinase CheA
VPNEMDEIVAEFLVESLESLDRLDRDLLALERDPGSREVLASIFRTMHTIKGTCGFLGFGRLERVAHAAENLLAGMRDGSRSMTPEIAGTLLRTGDSLRSMLDRIATT